jgi:hypothetical protein
MDASAQAGALCHTSHNNKRTRFIARRKWKPYYYPTFVDIEFHIALTSEDRGACSAFLMDLDGT